MLSTQNETLTEWVELMCQKWDNQIPEYRRDYLVMIGIDDETLAKLDFNDLPDNVQTELSVELMEHTREYPDYPERCHDEY